MSMAMQTNDFFTLDFGFLRGLFIAAKYLDRLDGIAEVPGR